MRSYLYLLMILCLTGCAVDPDLFTDIITPNSSQELKNTIIPKKHSLKKLNNNNNDNIFIWPIKGEIVSMFGPHTDGIYNDGINIRAEYGSPINPTYNGEVIYVAENLKDFGKLILISHPNGYVSSYAHLSKINVKKGLLKTEAKNLYESYIKNRNKKLPFVTGKIAVSNNKLIYSKGTKRITDSSTDKLTHYLRFKNDSIMISSKTLNIDNPKLDCRLEGFEKFSPRRIVLDKHLEINRKV